MKLKDYSDDAILQRLKYDGLQIKIGEFVISVQSSLDTVVEGITQQYSEYPVVEAQGFIDFYLKLSMPNNIRRWYRPQVEFLFDGFRPFKPLPLNQAFAMFEWSLNWCVANHMHNYLIIHAAVIEKHGQALIMPAPPGSGKSTLCASLVMEGWRLLSDELTLVASDAKHITALPRPVNLKNESIEIIRARYPDAFFGKVVKETNKGTVSHLKPPVTSVASANKSAQPAIVVFPKYCEGSETILSPISKASSFMKVAQNSFNYRQLGEVGFDTLGTMIDQCESYEFVYSDLDEAILCFSDLIKAA